MNMFFAFYLLLANGEWISVFTIDAGHPDAWDFCQDWDADPIRVCYTIQES